MKAFKRNLLKHGIAEMKLRTICRVTGSVKSMNKTEHFVFLTGFKIWRNFGQTEIAETRNW